MKPAIVLDKSYLEGASSQAIGDLCKSFAVLMIDTLFMELLTTSDKHFQAACFRKFPQRENPVELIEGTGSLLRYDSSTSGRPRRYMIESYLTDSFSTPS
jgi:hypothetical protein